MNINRRDFMISLAASGMVPGISSTMLAQELPAGKKIKLGFDNFSIRSFGWKAPQLIDYAASLKVDTLLMSDLEVYESLNDEYLLRIREHAKDKGIEIQVGTGSICPTSLSYDEKKWGKAEDHLKLLVRVAKTVGSSVARCYQGTGRDRNGDGGIYRHMEVTAKVCKSVRSRAMDDGVKIAIENHAGDMQAWELVDLIEAAGKEYVGATMDPGNAAWTMEDPLLNLEILGPYALVTGIRDSAIWETPKGAAVMWTNMGGGVVDWNKYVKRFAELCPTTPFVLEVLSYNWQKDLSYYDTEMWKNFSKARASEFARFVELAKNGKPFQIPDGRPSGAKSKELEQAQQKYDLEQSLAYCRNVLGLGFNG